ncbi:MAG: hypothetical protein ACPG5P_05050, partial [Saprospiraceae bacterium]
NLILQGDWYKDGFDIKAFTFKDDSMFFPGLERPFPYEIRKDTLIIQFEAMETRSIFLSSSSSELVMWDETLTKDTIHFDRIPDVLVEEIKKKK